MLTQNMEAALSNQPIPNHRAARVLHLVRGWAARERRWHWSRTCCGRSAALRSIAKVIYPVAVQHQRSAHVGVPVAEPDWRAVRRRAALCATNAWLVFFHFGMVTRLHLTFVDAAGADRCFG
jgi:hypothetical protein